MSEAPGPDSLPPESESRESGAAVATAEEDRPRPLEDPLLDGFRRPLVVLVTGASGFVGRHLLERLASRGHRIRAVSRSGRPEEEVGGGNVSWVAADVTRPGEVAGLARECDAVVHLAGIRRERGDDTFRRVHVEGTRHLLEEAGRAGVQRFVHVSALGAGSAEGPDADAFLASKRAAEEVARASPVDSTILRPAVIFGPGDHFTSAVVRWLERSPVFLVPAAWNGRVQPVSIEDVVDALCQSVERDDVAGSTHVLAGPEPLTLVEVARTVAAVMGWRRAVFTVPDRLAGVVLTLVRGYAAWRDVPHDEWELLRRAGRLPVPPEGVNAFRSVFQIEPMPLGEVLEDYL